MSAPTTPPTARLRPGEDGEHVTFCRLCEALCGLSVEVRDGRIAKVGPDRAHPVSEGHICVKGARMLDVVHDPDRVLHPLRRTGGDGEFERVSWDEALDDIAERLSAIVARHGGDSVATYLGNPASFASLHPAYMNGFLRALGGGKRFNSMHADTAAKNLALELTYGNPYRYTFPDLEDCDFLIIIGGNPAVSHMSLISEPRVLQRLDAIAARGGIVVVDPRRTETARRYEHLPVRPDSDVWLLALLLRTVFDEGLYDPAALDGAANGWRELRAAVCAVDAAEAAARCGVELAAARDLARRFAGARTAACYTRLGTGRGSFSTLTNLLVEALNVVTGRLGQQGGWVIGQGPVDLFKTNANPYGTRRSRIGGLPLILGIMPGGSLADEITTPGDGQVRALFVDSGNPVLSYPRGDRLEAALTELELMVSFDLYVTETTRWSHYILPSTTFLERPDLNELWGANAPRPWVQYSDAVLPPQGEARNEYDIYAEILTRMGLPSPLAMLGSAARPDPQPIEAADALLRAGRWGDALGAAGLSVARLRDELPHGVRFVERVDAPATRELVHYADRKARLWGELQAAEFARLGRTGASAVDGEQLLLFGRRRLQSLNSWMHNSERLTRGHAPTLQIHPDDARRCGVEDGQAVRVTSAARHLLMVAEVTDEVVRGSACYPHGWGHRGGWRRANGIGGANVNLLASDDPADWEQVSGVCLLDGIPVRVEPA
ncbi:molybdopterin-dependent oxidoreductase [Phenylobacterium sp. LjRoot219]|uniref:molybdopterin-containing oxidoreductase family protein n=1 Tax=Phenylobacterium sp. LjRoot219 TaxID=3342283 RepID=UPI003ECC42DD